MRVPFRLDARRLAAVAGAALAAAWPSAAAGQVCCPSGCVQDGPRCITAGATHYSCPVVACPSGGGGGRGASPPGRGSPVSVPILPARPPSRTPYLGGRCRYNLPAGPPPGSYRKTCNNIAFRCSADEDRLIATCRGSGHLVTSTLLQASKCHDIENSSGTLHCRDRRPPVSEF